MKRLKGALKYTFFITMYLFGRALGQAEERHPKPEQIRRILVLLGGGVGDVLRGFPAMQALRKAFPTAAITVLVTEPHQEVLEFFPDRRAISERIFLDLKGEHHSLISKLALIFFLRRQGFDLIYNPSRGAGMLEHACLAFLIGACYRIGFEIEGFRSLHTTHLPFHGDRPIVLQNLALLERGGIGKGEAEIQLSLPGRDLAFARELSEQRGIEESRRVVVVHPGASWQDVYRTWPFQKYVALVEALLDDPIVHVILLGNERERDKFGKELDVLQHPRLINLVGKTSLGQAAAVIASSTLFVGNDSGLLHIALALKVPAVAIFGPTAPEQVLSPRAPCIVVQQGVPCQPCYRHRLSEVITCHYNIRCLHQLSLPEVLTAVQTALRKECIS
jgi:lipopolysaccharide heptosyltransferase II